MEKSLRAIAFFGGSFAVLAANAAHVGFAQFTVNSLSDVRPTGGGIKFLVTIIPGGAGVALGWYFTRLAKRPGGTFVGYRILSFVGMAAITSYTVTYADAFKLKGVELGAAALPNATFIVGLIVYIMLKYDPDGLMKAAHSSVRKSGRRTLWSALREGSSTPADSTEAA
jgi:hypothetical protein